MNFLYMFFPNQAADIIAVSTSLLDALPTITSPTESKLHGSKQISFHLLVVQFVSVYAASYCH